MKPVSITMQAFGPYREKASVRFDSISSPIFLITGPTGGGKTTILDAMCFALYCRATGGRRTWGDMRCLSSNDTQETFVDFEFQLGAESYRFRRSLQIHEVRGSGRRELRDEHACFKRQDGEWKLLASGTESKVRTCAEELLGLTCEQFSQVIVLPQGEFRKLLLSTSREKAAIFETLFSTGRWAAASNAVKEMADRCKKEQDELFTRKNQILAAHAAEDSAGLVGLFTQAEEQATRYEKQSAVLQAALDHENTALSAALSAEENFVRLEGLTREREALLARKDGMEKTRAQLKQAQLVSAVIPYFAAAHSAKEDTLAKQTQLVAAQRAEREAEQRLTQAGEQAAPALQLRNRAADMTAQAARLEAAMKDSEKLQNFQIQKVRLLKELDNTVEQEGKLKEQLQKAVENIEKGKAFIRGIEEQIARIPGLSEQVQVFSRSLDAQREYLKKKSEEKEVGAAYTAANAAYQQSQVKLSALKAHLEQAEAALRQDMAGTLAATLTDNAPCPVCGSREHPHPANREHGLTNAQVAEILRASVKEEESKAEALHRRLAEAQALHERLQIDVQEALKRCGDKLMDVQQLAVSLEAAQKELAQAQTSAGRMQEAQQRLSQREQEKTGCEQSLETLREQKGKYERSLEAARAGESTLLETLPPEAHDPQTLQKHLTDARKKAQELSVQSDRLQKALNDAQSGLAAAAASRQAALKALEEAKQKEQAAFTRLQKEAAARSLPADTDFAALRVTDDELARMETGLQQYDTALAALTKQLNALTQQLKDAVRPNITDCRERQQSAQEAVRAASEQKGALQQKLKQLKQSCEQVAEIERAMEGIQAEYERTTRLSLLMSGKNGAKIPLHQFVLGIMLDDILTSANQYFATLSKGRYALNRSSGGGTGNAYGGLDLEILDGHSGGKRAVDTLSGGELFLASLSLAFGLSDVVQCQSGGVRLDSIFIDEGFGSLDSETLDTVMKALYDIQRLGRTVGIISHVQELKMRIQARIEVTSAPDGSSTVTVREL